MEQGEMLDRLTDLALDRRNRYRTSVLGRFPSLETIHERTILGMFSWTLQQSKQRWLIDMNTVNLTGYPQTRTEITRDYLGIVHPNRLRAKGHQARAFNVHRAPPTLAKVGRWGDCVLVDLKSAYWSILQIAGWDADYTPARWILPGRVPFDFPLIDDKIARICLVSAGLNSPTRVWTGKQIIQIRTGNTQLNLGLWSLCQDVLHSIAGVAEKLGAVYIHTDGYIVPRASAQMLMDYIAQYGLVGRPKAEGNTQVFAVGSYICGKTQTKNIVHSLKPYWNTLYETDEPFIRKRMGVLADWRRRTGNLMGGSKSPIE